MERMLGDVRQRPPGPRRSRGEKGHWRRGDEAGLCVVRLTQRGLQQSDHIKIHRDIKKSKDISKLKSAQINAQLHNHPSACHAAERVQHPDLSDARLQSLREPGLPHLQFLYHMLA